MQVTTDRPRGQEHALGNLLVGQARGGQQGDLPLLGGQRRRGGAPADSPGQRYSALTSQLPARGFAPSDATLRSPTSGSTEPTSARRGFLLLMRR
jgi:hypothetical protein